MMTARECFKLAYGATRLAWNADTRIGWVGPQAIAQAVEYAACERGDPLARHFPGRILRILEYKRDRIARPWVYQSYNCRCVATPITAQPPTPEQPNPPRS